MPPLKHERPLEAGTPLATEDSEDSPQSIPVKERWLRRSGVVEPFRQKLAPHSVQRVVRPPRCSKCGDVERADVHIPRSSRSSRPVKKASTSAAARSDEIPNRPTSRSTSSSRVVPVASICQRSAPLSFALRYVDEARSTATSSLSISRQTSASGRSRSSRISRDRAFRARAHGGRRVEKRRGQLRVKELRTVGGVPTSVLPPKAQRRPAARRACPGWLGPRDSSRRHRSTSLEGGRAGSTRLKEVRGLRPRAR